MNENDITKFQAAVERSRKPRWPLWILVALFVCGNFAKDRWDAQQRLDRVREMTEVHIARDNSFQEPEKLVPWKPESRAAWVNYWTATCGELDRYETEQKKFNDGKLAPANQADFASSRKLCTDMFLLLNDFEKSQWVPGVDGKPTMKNGPVKDDANQIADGIPAELDAFNKAEAAVDAAYAKEQK